MLTLKHCKKTDWEQRTVLVSHYEAYSTYPMPVDSSEYIAVHAFAYGQRSAGLLCTAVLT